ncbi:MAG: DUF4214 domain-containing protein [Burkholderiaceae bacterium]|nr:DUF4214 domain-containing protein [Burkholderiaceae bacterium]
MAAISTPDLYKAYLAYFGRPPDLTGLGYFSNKTEAEVIATFSASPESQNLFGSLPIPQQINAIYNNLFNRDAEPAGLEYWTTQLTLGNITLAEASMAILRGAQGTDAQTVTAKYNAQVAFTDALDTSAEIAAYSGTEAADDGRAFLATVDYQNIPTNAEVQAAVLVATTPNPPVTPVPTLDIAVSSTTVNEGGTVVFTVVTTNVAAGTTYVYNLDGVSAADIVGGNLSGTVVIDSTGKGYVTVGVTSDLLTEGNETMTMVIGSSTSVGVTIEDTSVTPPPPPVVDQTYVLTVNADVIHAGAGNDTFVGTQNTLQLGDSLFGGEGNDTLDLSISGSGSYVNGFATDSVETVKVKSLSTSDSTLDVSDVKGPVTLMSNETDGASLTFHDVQSINATNIVVVDTDESHTFQYDVGNSASNNDVAEIAVQEMRAGSFITLENNGTPGQSFVDQIILDSAVRADPGVQPSNTFKNDMGLRAGDDLDTLTIVGDADLLITNVLDQNISLVDAHAHTGAQGVNSEVQNIIGNHWELELDMSNSNDGQPFAADGVAEVTVRGSQGDNKIDFGSNNGHDAGTTHNNKIVDFNGGAGVQDIDSSAFVGNDWLRTGSGEASVNSGAGNDTVLTGALNDVVIAGAGNDMLVDQGSTSNLFNHGNIYNPWYSSNGNQFDLGAGNDNLTVLGNSNNTVSAGDGNDVISVAGSVVDGFANDQVFTNVISNYDLGNGNDQITIGDSYREGQIDFWAGSRGSNYVSGGAGNDAISIFRDGDQTVMAGEGNDVVRIIQDENQYSSDHFDGTTRDGNHYVDLGDGNDNLLITGRSNTLLTTVVIGGSGNDVVRIDQDHELNADLGTGNDSLQLRAEDLQSDDTIDGGAGYDTIILSNTTYGVQTGQVLASETRKVSHVEQFNLLDAGIVLTVTDNLVDTADNKTLTVDTTGSSYNGDVTLPIALPNTLFQGMLWNTYSLWDVTNNLTSNLVAERTPNPDPLLAGNSSNDLVFFVYAPNVFVPAQTVDLTALNTVDYTFVLTGGGLRDIVIVDEDALSTDLYLNFDGGAGAGGADAREGWAFTDTLQVVNGANMTVQDLENVFDMEIIDLVSTLNASQTWNVELDNHVINQPTGTNVLTIRVDPTVPAGSNVYVTFSEDDVNLATNDVIVERNANVNVYVVIRDSNGNEVVHLVTEDQYNRTVDAFEFANTGFHVIVNSQLLFTTSSDNLFGNDGSNTFIATSINQVQNSDIVDGNVYVIDPDNVTVVPGDDSSDDFDTVELQFAVANQNDNLWEQLNDVSIWDVEQIRFNTQNQVQMNGLGGEDFAIGLEYLTTGIASDRLLNMERSGLVFTLNAGNDYLSVSDYGDFQRGSFYATVSGGEGRDTVVGSMGNDVLTLGLVEAVNAGSGDDSVYFSTGGTMLENSIGGNDGDVSVDMGMGEDYLQLDNNGTNGTVTVWNAEDIQGGAGMDTIVAYINASSTYGSGTASMEIYGANDDDHITAFGTSGTSVSVWGENGNDTINVDTSNPGSGYGFSNYVYVSGGSGNDVINVGSSSPAYVEVDGDNGNDVINVFASQFADVDGGSDNDVISVTVGTTIWGNSVDADASVGGGSGNDDLTVRVQDDATVWGGSGNDVISVTSDNDIANGSGSAGSYVYGEAGNDTISVFSPNDTDTPFTITGGQGNDLIQLGGNRNGVDTLMFGNIAYSAYQVASNDQGLDHITGFQFENSIVGGDPVPLTQDFMNFSAFLGNTINTANEIVVAGTWTRGTTEVANTAAGNSIVVLSAPAGSNYVLDANDFSVNLPNTIQLNDNSRAVVVVGQDQTGSGSGISDFDVYYVQDIDSGAGQTWAVTKVADVQGATRVGISEVLDNLTAGLADAMVVTPTNTTINAGNDLNDLTVVWTDHVTTGVSVINFDPQISGAPNHEDMFDFFAGSNNFFDAGTLFFDVNVNSNTVYLINNDANPVGDVSTSGAGGDKFVISNGDDAILLAASSNGSTTANVYHMFDSDPSGGVTASLVLIGTVSLTGGNFGDLGSANFV